MTDGGSTVSWVTLAGLSALFAGLTAVLAKVGIENVPSNLATLIRTVVIVAFASGIVAARGEYAQLRAVSGKAWTFLVLSGLATGLSWLFYFAALKRGPVSADPTNEFAASDPLELTQECGL